MQALREKMQKYRAAYALKYPAKKPAAPEQNFGYFNAWNCPVGRLCNAVKVAPIVSDKSFFIQDEPLPF